MLSHIKDVVTVQPFKKSHNKVSEVVANNPCPQKEDADFWAVCSKNGSHILTTPACGLFTAAGISNYS
jgi:hypothetical protein